MAKTKRRQQPRGFGKTSTRKKSSERKFFQTNDSEFLQACEQSPELSALWFCMVDFIQGTSSLTKKQAIKFWLKYWEMATKILGQVHIGNPEYRTEHSFWLGRIKGVIMLAVQNLHNCLTTASMSQVHSELYNYSDATKQVVWMGEATIEIGLAFQEDLIIYHGKNLILYKGSDDVNGRGELVIAVKHSSGCWNYFPSSDNVPVPLSDYKRAKLELERFPVSLKGELIHPQSAKLAKLLGLTVKENYAYLIK